MSSLIEKYRKKLGLSKYKMAKDLHITQPALAAYEFGKSVPRMDIMMDMYNFFIKNGIEVDVLGMLKEFDRNFRKRWRSGDKA